MRWILKWREKVMRLRLRLRWRQLCQDTIGTRNWARTPLRLEAMPNITRRGINSIDIINLSSKYISLFVLFRSN